MTTTLLIPLQNTPQKFNISLAGTEYIMTCRWNDAFEAGWVIDFADVLTATPIIANLPLICGADILAGLGYLGFQGQLFIYTDGNQFAVPTYTNLGVESNLYFLTEVVGG